MHCNGHKHLKALQEDLFVEVLAKHPGEVVRLSIENQHSLEVVKLYHQRICLGEAFLLQKATCVLLTEISIIARKSLD